MRDGDSTSALATQIGGRSDGAPIGLLLIEGDAHDSDLIKHALEAAQGVHCDLTHRTLLAEALEILGSRPFDVILLDLELPDSQGVKTFVAVRSHAPDTPILVLTGSDGDAVAEAVLNEGAYDYLVKPQVRAPLLGRTIRHALEHAQLLAELSDARLRARHADEITQFERMSNAATTPVTASLYSAAPLREFAPSAFADMVARYGFILDQALHRRMYKDGDYNSAELRSAALNLGFMRSSPRDLIDIHTEALRTKTTNAPWERAQAYLEEGRLIVLELMGNLAGYYRNFYVSPARKEGGDA